MCPCGSGKKFKYCCLNEEEALAQKLSAFIYEYGMVSKKAKIKQCIHPNKDKCSGGIIKAHAIQNNRVLSKLAVNGMVQTVDGVSNLMFQGAQSKGRKVATTFSGFCSYHDKTLFQAIEDREFEGTQQQIFLYTYRTFAWHYHKKLEEINKNSLARNLAIEHKLPAMTRENNEMDIYQNNLIMCALENQEKLEEFNQYLLNEKYSQVRFAIWELSYEVQFAVSTMLEIEHDILGNVMNNLHVPKPLKSIYLNIFPGKEKSFCIWSWLKNDIMYDAFVQQFMDLSIDDRCNYLNNNLPRWTDAITFSPRLWDKWGGDIQQALMAHSNFEMLYRQMEFEKQKYAYEYMYTPWDFFEEF